MSELLTRIFAALFGDDRHYSLEHRLFNTLSLLNGVTNIGGALSMLRFANYKFLLLLHLSTGGLFLVFYYFARWRNVFRRLYWPFVLLTLAFVLIQQLMRDLMARNIVAARPYWQLRVGINSGSVVAGVIGREKFAYDVWGDTVNTASRLESSGEANQINISQVTYAQVQDFFVCAYRGKVAAKNKGEIDMYFVQGLRPELSQAGNGYAPNERFFELYARLAQQPVVV
jgi:Adenylate and Guanylate cyclase catalytic domain